MTEVWSLTPAGTYWGLEPPVDKGLTRTKDWEPRCPSNEISLEAGADAGFRPCRGSGSSLVPKNLGVSPGGRSVPKRPRRSGSRSGASAGREGREGVQEGDPRRSPAPLQLTPCVAETRAGTNPRLELSLFLSSFCLEDEFRQVATATTAESGATGDVRLLTGTVRTHLHHGKVEGGHVQGQDQTLLWGRRAGTGWGGVGALGNFVLPRRPGSHLPSKVLRVETVHRTTPARAVLGSECRGTGHEPTSAV